MMAVRFEWKNLKIILSPAGPYYYYCCDQPGTPSVSILSSIFQAAINIE